MNLYLATSHILSLLEEPLQPEAFQAAVLPRNPLFATHCINPQKFLFFLADEGLLNTPKQGFVLSESGWLLHQHVLNWTARDKSAVQERKTAFQARTQAPPLEPECPLCHSRFCALYVFVILLERLYAGLESWNDWRPGELAILGESLEACLPPELSELYLYGETVTLQDFAPKTQAQVATQLKNEAHCLEDPELVADFRHSATQRHLLPESGTLPGLKHPHRRIGRLRFNLGLLPEATRQVLYGLADPELYARFYHQGPPDGKRAFVQLTRPGLNQAQNQALLLLKCNQRINLLLLEKHLELGWQRIRNLPLQNQDMV